jgi:hypothetical protein
MRGFVSLTLIAAVAGGMLIAALAVQSWRLSVAQEEAGAYKVRTAQLEADVAAQAQALADERAERARVDALLLAAAEDAAKARQRALQADARYRDALRDSAEARAWADTLMPAAAINRLCDEPGSDPDGAGADPATYCAARGLPNPAAAGATE